MARVIDLVASGVPAGKVKDVFGCTEAVVRGIWESCQWLQVLRGPPADSVLELCINELARLLQFND